MKVIELIVHAGGELVKRKDLGRDLVKDSFR